MAKEASSENERAPKKAGGLAPDSAPRQVPSEEHSRSFDPGGEPGGSGVPPGGGGGGQGEARRINRHFLRARRELLILQPRAESPPWWKRLESRAVIESYDYLPSNGLSRGDIGYGERYELVLTADGVNESRSLFVRTRSGRITLEEAARDSTGEPSQAPRTAPPSELTSAAPPESTTDLRSIAEPRAPARDTSG